MARVPVFYSFHFDNDAMRAQQVRNIGAFDGNEPVLANEWESIRRRGDAAIERWIDDNMKRRDCVVVLIGSDTASRKWVLYEISKAHNEGRGLLGIYIHNLNCPRLGKCAKGPNPFDYVKLDGWRPLSNLYPTYDPTSWDAYGEISRNITGWVDHAVAQRRR
jgi:hypothetical protein